MELERETGRPQPPCWCTQADFDPQALRALPEEARGRACICHGCAGSPAC
jgi:Cysteine-rich CWC